jgi:hypothetical protein
MSNRNGALRVVRAGRAPTTWTFASSERSRLSRAIVSYCFVGICSGRSWRSSFFTRGSFAPSIS